MGGDIKMDNLSFYDWLSFIDGDESPEGDFAHDALKDSSFPVNATSWEPIEKHLELHGEDIVEIAKGLFKTYAKETHHQN